MNAVVEKEGTDVALRGDQSGASQLLTAITQASTNPNVDMDKMERFFAMHKELVAIEAKKQFNDAMARAQAKIEPVATNAENTHTHSKYAKLSAINRAIVPIYTAEGLSVTFNTGKTDLPGCIRILATVSHAAGHCQEYHLDLPLDDAGAKGNANKTGVQATGSTNSYGRRYLTMMIFNVATHDDNDGNKTTVESLSDEEFATFKKEIEATITKAAARAAYNVAVKVCNARQDVASHKRLKDVLLKHGEFIDSTEKDAKK